MAASPSVLGESGNVDSDRPSSMAAGGCALRVTPTSSASVRVSIGPAPPHVPPPLSAVADSGGADADGTGSAGPDAGAGPPGAAGGGCAWPAGRGIWLSVQRPVPLSSAEKQKSPWDITAAQANATGEWWPLGYQHRWAVEDMAAEFGGVRCAAGCWLRVCAHHAEPMERRRLQGAAERGMAGPEMEPGNVGGGRGAQDMPGRDAAAWGTAIPGRGADAPRERADIQVGAAGRQAASGGNMNSPGAAGSQNSTSGAGGSQPTRGGATNNQPAEEGRAIDSGAPIHSPPVGAPIHSPAAIPPINSPAADAPPADHFCSAPSGLIKTRAPLLLPKFGESRQEVARLQLRLHPPLAAPVQASAEAWRLCLATALGPRFGVQRLYPGRLSVADVADTGTFLYLDVLPVDTYNHHEVAITGPTVQSVLAAMAEMAASAHHPPTDANASASASTLPTAPISPSSPAAPTAAAAAAPQKKISTISASPGVGGLSPCGISVVPPILQQPVGGGTRADWRAGAWPTLDKRGIAADSALVWDAESGTWSDLAVSSHRSTHSPWLSGGTGALLAAAALAAAAAAAFATLRYIARRPRGSKIPGGGAAWSGARKRNIPTGGAEESGAEGRRGAAEGWDGGGYGDAMGGGDCRGGDMCLGSRGGVGAASGHRHVVNGCVGGAGGVGRGGSGGGYSSGGRAADLNLDLAPSSTIAARGRRSRARLLQAAGLPSPPGVEMAPAPSFFPGPSSILQRLPTFGLVGRWRGGGYHRAMDQATDSPQAARPGGRGGGHAHEEEEDGDGVVEDDLLADVWARSTRHLPM